MDAIQKLFDLFQQEVGLEVEVGEKPRGGKTLSLCMKGQAVEEELGQEEESLDPQQLMSPRHQQAKGEEVEEEEEAWVQFVALQLQMMILEPKEEFWDQWLTCT